MEKNYIRGHLPGGQNVLKVFPHCATKSIISESFVQSSHYLSSIAPKQIVQYPLRLVMVIIGMHITLKNLRFQLKVISSI